MYTPQFPYTGNQAIITSDRVTLLADKDSVFVFGRQAVSLSSVHTINIDANDRVTISSPIISLGAKDADTNGEPVLLGNSLVNQLLLLLDNLNTFFIQAADVQYSDLSTLRTNISAPANALSKKLTQIRNAIQNSTRSEVVFLQKNSTS
jgi:hypothetical protein